MLQSQLKRIERLLGRAEEGEDEVGRELDVQARSMKGGE